MRVISRISAAVSSLVALVLAGGAAGYFALFVDPSSPAREATLSPAAGPDAADRRRAEEDARRKAEDEQDKTQHVAEFRQHSPPHIRHFAEVAGANRHAAGFTVSIW